MTSTRQKIKESIQVLVVNFLEYDRRDDAFLGKDQLMDAFKNQHVNAKEISDWFYLELEEQLK